TVTASSEFAVTQRPAPPGGDGFNDPVAAINSQGNAGVVVWDGTTSQFPNPNFNTNSSIWGQLFTLSGPVGQLFRVSTPSAAGHQHSPSVALDAAGDFVVVWQDETGTVGNGIEVYAQRYSAGGV